ncbi:hypothetical protein GCM10023084_53890 [Streptomyces lacrimifluminis]|uniref:Uncharacterized protein n=1 Tax=Streptomyces lacrimifluminis TaxID=1500077 RepID=A0A917NXC4_9ACTN|nr:hypothetical protein [Streptomyces lacrimifluminis]GGJ34409.1 hypothetical protein GCM10012282_33970 [Streptomyces lacrimifluminis]
MKLDELTDSELIQKIAYALHLAVKTSLGQEKVDECYAYCSVNGKLDVYKQAFEQFKQQVIIVD